jgi:DNA polymerase
MTKADQLQQVYQELEQAKPKLPLGNLNEPIVPGDGNPDSEMMFIGEAPGYYESVQRKPFVGKSGQLFIATLAQVGYPRESVYISNIVKIRPPDNRDPLPNEIAAFKPFLDREIHILQPKLIITLGRFSMSKFLPEVKISQVHGRLHKVKWNDQPLFILPMYHPAAALRNPKMKESFVQDFQKIPKILSWLKDQKDVDQLADSIKEALL